MTVLRIRPHALYECRVTVYVRYANRSGCTECVLPHRVPFPILPSAILISQGGGSGRITVTRPSDDTDPERGDDLGCMNWPTTGVWGLW